MRELCSRVILATQPLCMQEIDIQQLLKVVHHYFMSLGVDEIRRRGVESEKSLRMVKTMVHELCRLLVSHSC